MLNPFKLLTIYRDLNRLDEIAEEKTSMQLKIAQILSLIVSLVGAISIPAFATTWLQSHQAIYVGFVAAAIVLHTIFPSIFAAPSDAAQLRAGLNKVGMILLVLGLGALCSMPARAQSASNGFVTSSAAVALDYKGVWSAGNYTAESYDLFETGSVAAQTHWYLQGIQLTAPGPGFSIYAGGLGVQPNLAKLIAKTNIPAGSLGFTANTSVGVGVPSSGQSTIAELFSVTLTQKLTSNLTWQTVTAGYGRNGSEGFGFASTGLVLTLFKPSGLSAAARAK